MREQLRAIRDGLLKLEWSVKSTDKSEQSTMGDRCPACGGYENNHHCSSKPPFPREKHVTGPDCWLRNAIIWIDDYLTADAPIPDQNLSTALDKCIAFIKMARRIEIGVDIHELEDEKELVFIDSIEGFPMVGIMAAMELDSLFEMIKSLRENRDLLVRDVEDNEDRADILEKENIRLAASEENLAEGLEQAMGFIAQHTNADEEILEVDTHTARVALKRYKKGSFQHRHERHKSILSGMRAREEEILT